MINKVCTIGIGNTGNQIVQFGKEAKGIDGFAINSSERDLRNLTVPKILIGDEKGAGKDRDAAKLFIKENARGLLTEKSLVDMIKENDIINVISSTDGGTGSGMAPMLTDILKQVYPTKRFIITGVLPPLKESVAAQQNSIDYLKEILGFNPTYMLYDNGRRANLSTTAMMEQINREVIEDLCVIRGDYQLETQFSSIDEKDSFKIYETPGRLVVVRIGGFKEKDLDDKSIEDRLIDELRVNAHVELDRDQIIKRMGFIVNVSEKINRNLDNSMQKLKSVIGEPIEGFEHIRVNPTDDEQNRVFVVLSGMSIPDDRVERMVQRIDEVTALLTKTKESSILDTTNMDLINNLRGNKKVEVEGDKVDLDNAMSKYFK